VKAICFQGEQKVSYEAIEDPSIRHGGDAIVRTRVSAICGSDLHVYFGRETGIELGTAMGHEFQGEVVEVGPEVRSLKRGDIVVSPFTTNCGACFYCRRGLTCRCDRGELFGWVENGQGLEGAQAEYVRVPLADSTLVVLPKGLDEEKSLLLGDVLPTGFFCAEMAEVSPRGTYAVIGCGPVGLASIIGCREHGAERVFALDVLPERLALAGTFGAAPIHAEEEDALGILREVTDGRGADAVLEAVGSPQATRLAIDLVRPGGIVAAVGVHTESTFAFSPVEAYDKNLTYRAGRCPARRFIERLLPIVEGDEYDLTGIFSHRLSLSEGARGYELFARRLEGCTKVLLRP
jgi:threonine dehydrogenase-like Zn-dependent dehydrogenase